MPVPDGPQFKKYTPGYAVTPEGSDKFLVGLFDAAEKKPHEFKDFVGLVDVENQVGAVGYTTRHGSSAQYLFNPFGHASLN